MKIFSYFNLSFFCFLFLVFNISTSAQTTTDAAKNQKAQSEAQIQKLKKQIENIGRGNDITIITTDNKYYYGSVLNIEDDLVFINDVDRNDTAEIKYNTIKKVRKNYGVNRDLYGRRIPTKKNLTGILIGTAAIAIPIILVITLLK